MRSPEPMTYQNETLTIFVYESISVSDVFIAGIIIERITTWEVPRNETLVSVAEYRRLVGDNTSTDARITERLRYLEAFCRNIIKPELQNHYDKSKTIIIT